MYVRFSSKKKFSRNIFIFFTGAENAWSSLNQKPKQLKTFSTLHLVPHFIFSALNPNTSLSPGHRRRQGQVLLRQRSPQGRHGRREPPLHLRSHHLEGHGDLQAVGHRAAVRGRFVGRRQARLLQHDASWYVEFVSNLASVIRFYTGWQKQQFSKGALFQWYSLLRRLSNIIRF